jgi:predicted transposase YdaD
MSMRAHIGGTLVAAVVAFVLGMSWGERVGRERGFSAGREVGKEAGRIEGRQAGYEQLHEINLGLQRDLQITLDRANTLQARADALEAKFGKLDEAR